MFVLPIVDQLRYILEKDCNWNLIFQSRQKNLDQVSDVYDGKLYQELRRKAHVTLQFNCDGAPIFNSSKFSIWPLVYVA